MNKSYGNFSFFGFQTILDIKWDFFTFVLPHPLLQCWDWCHKSGAALVAVGGLPNILLHFQHCFGGEGAKKSNIFKILSKNPLNSKNPIILCPGLSESHFVKKKKKLFRKRNFFLFKTYRSINMMKI